MEVGRCLSRSACLAISVAFLVVSLCGQTNGKSCTPSSCGNIHNITFPFRLDGDPKHCGDSRYTLHCENNQTVLSVRSCNYTVQEIIFDNSSSMSEQYDGRMRVIDQGIQKNNCSSIPRYPLLLPKYITSPHVLIPLDGSEYWLPSRPVTFFTCTNPVNSSRYVETAPCINTSVGTSLSLPTSYGYVMIDTTNASDLEVGCTVEWSTAISDLYQQDQNTSYKDIHDALLHGFELQWYYSFSCKGWNLTTYDCYPYTISGFFHYLAVRLNVFLAANLVLSIIFGVLFLARFMMGIGFFIYKWRRRHLSVYSTIEDFLQSDNFIPIRYSYSDIKKMTRGFKDKLGEGGYGSVFKGKLRSGHFGAIKMLGKPKTNGEELISEIATLGRIHHVNVVQLVGYCVEGSKRALVYDFMPNGSLDKYIYAKEESAPLGCEKMYEICIGVAKGIEYLHQGCDMQILHFDIKPHNILLDENFIPKISDFGLAKLYRIDDSIVSLTAARGTMGYIAPELFYKNIGRVSYKADVYSFGMLLMEMASRRKNLNAIVDHSSQIYFPSWVYDQYNEGKDLEMNYVLEEEKHIIKKMVITALWCIQLKPDDRPSMKKVLEMLEGSVEHLQMSPKPYLCSQQMPVGDVHVNNLDPTCSNTELTISTLSAR